MKPSPSSELRARVLAEVATTPSATRSEVARRALIGTAAGLLATVVLFVVMGGITSGARPGWLVALTGALGFVVAFGLTLALRQQRARLGGPRAVLVGVALLTSPVLALVTLAAGSLTPGGHDVVGAQTDALCGAMTVAQAALPLFVLLAPRRGTDPVHPAALGAALGATAGAWAATMAFLRCPHTSVLHGVLAHAGPVVLIAGLGAALGARWLGLRSPLRSSFKPR